VLHVGLRSSLQAVGRRAQKIAVQTSPAFTILKGLVLNDVAGRPRRDPASRAPLDRPVILESPSSDAIRADGADTLGAAGQYFRRVTRPTPWLRARRGLLNQVPGLHPDAVAAQICAEVPALRDMLVDDVNRYTIALSENGARVVADVIRSQM
jgi:hypothetical protein